VNVPTNLNLLQNVLLRMPYDDLSIVMLLKRKLKYIYDRLFYPNILIKVVLQLCHISANFFIRSNWKDFIKFANASKTLISNIKLLKMMSMKKILTNLK